MSNELCGPPMGHCLGCDKWFIDVETMRGHADTCEGLAKLDRAARIRAAAPEMLKMLGELEFANIEHSCSGTGFCPLCGEHHEHAPDCKLAALLKRLA